MMDNLINAFKTLINLTFPIIIEPIDNVYKQTLKCIKKIGYTYNILKFGIYKIRNN